MNTATRKLVTPGAVKRKLRWEGRANENNVTTFQRDFLRQSEAMSSFVYYHAIDMHASLTYILGLSKKSTQIKGLLFALRWIM